MKNLADVPLAEQQEFIDSFDHVLADLDGVVWLAGRCLPGSAECIETFKKIGKRVNYVSNHAARTVEYLYDRMKSMGISGQPEDIVNPLVAVVDYLKKINFDKELFVLSTEAYKKELSRAGFKVAPDPPQTIEENMHSVLSHIADDPNVQAVVYDFDLNLTYLKLQKCLTYLKRKDCLFIVGAADREVPIGQLGPLIGNKYFYQSLKEISGREPLQLAKPSADYNKYLVNKLDIRDPKKVLFIGDMIAEDMKMAAIGGYQKLLVLTGTAKKDNIINWKHSEDCKPNYYVESLGMLNKIMQSLNKET